MLERQNRGGAKDRHLLAVHDRLERGAHGDFGLAEADVATNQAVHRNLLLHVGLDVAYRPVLIDGQVVEEGVFELLLPGGVAREGVAPRRGTRGVQIEQVFCHLLHRLADLLLGALPTGAAQPVQVRPLSCDA